MSNGQGRFVPGIVRTAAGARGTKVAGNLTQPGCLRIHSVGSGAPWGTNRNGDSKSPKPGFSGSGVVGHVSPLRCGATRLEIGRAHV